LTLLTLPQRETNKLKDRLQRKDSVFPFLANRVFDHPKLLTILKEKIKYWLKLDNSETVLALAGYIYYLDDNFVKAENYFYKCLKINPENLDNWVDLIFSLYHQGVRKNKIAKAILFDIDLFMKRLMIRNHKNCSFGVLEKISKDLKNEKKDYTYTWHKYVSQKVEQ